MAFRISPILLYALVALFCFSSPTSAQSTGCGNLAPADCDLLNRAQQATSELQSGIFHVAVSLELSTGNLSFITVSLVGDGAYTRTQPTIDETAHPLVQSLFGLNADVSLRLDIQFNELIASEDDPFTTALDLRYDEGVGYADLTKLAPMIIPGQVGGWYSIDLVSFMTELMNDILLAGGSLADFDGIDEGALDLWGIIATFGIAQRLLDSQINGQAVTVFAIDASIGDYFRIYPAERIIARETIAQSVPELLGNIATPEQIEDTTNLLLDYLEAVRFRMYQHINQANELVQYTRIEINFAPDDAVGYRYENDLLSLSILALFEIAFVIEFEFIAFENDAYVPIPEDARPVRFEDIFGNGNRFSF